MESKNFEYHQKSVSVWYGRKKIWQLETEKFIRTTKNIQETEELVLSQEDKPGSHLSQRKIGRKLGVAQSSVNRMVEQDLQLCCFKKFRVKELMSGE